MKPQDVADAQTFLKEGELCQRILAEPDALLQIRGWASALLRSWSVINCRDPTATPSVGATGGKSDVLAKPRTSPIFHSGGAKSGRSHSG